MEKAQADTGSLEQQAKVQQKKEKKVERENFWLVWSPRGPYMPRYRHLTVEAAETEAQRLAQKFPNRHFYVMRSAGFRYVEDAEAPAPAAAPNPVMRQAPAIKREPAAKRVWRNGQPW